MSWSIWGISFATMAGWFVIGYLVGDMMFSNKMDEIKEITNELRKRR